MHAGRTEGVVTLDELLPNPRLYAVGALAGLRGELTIVAGRAYLSRATGADAAETVTDVPAGESAALFVGADVDAWVAVRTQRPVTFAELDAAIAELAQLAGVDTDGRFPFLVEGDVSDLEWHVIDGARLPAGASSHESHRAAAVRGHASQAAALLVGFFSRADQGVFTHMGAWTHVHCVVSAPLASGHVDGVTLPAGTLVRFPAAASRR
jgi:acetolactate decarboxylase